MNKNLIYDVGMHSGKDTEFYLKKGFNVVAIEANPILVKNAEEKFKKQTDKGKLVIVNKAISDEEGKIEFFVNQKNDEWSTISQDYVARNDKVKAHSEKVEVECCTFDCMLSQHGMPYYLKVDIEGFDILCIKSLKKFKELPKYLSVESSGTNKFEETFELLSHLYVLGYRKFKLINQAENYKIKLPEPAKEGNYIDHMFSGLDNSGAFGEETDGEWQDVQAIMAEYMEVHRKQGKYTVQAPKYNRYLGYLYRLTCRLLNRTPVGWYDIHCKLD